MKRRWIIFGMIVLGVMLLLTLIFAPTQNSTTQGSTYGRRPGDYGAWYQWMRDQGVEIQRWQKPFQDLPTDSPHTLIQVYPNLKDYMTQNQENWVKQGNTLIILGQRKPVTQAPFKTEQSTSVGTVIIETTRRNQRENHPLLADEYGSIVWRNSLGTGEIILATTPDLGANAYQNAVGNYEFLRQLVTEPDHPILIDEYLHGYGDPDTLKEEIGEHLWSYLSKTPLFPLFMQILILLALILWAQNRRFGRWETLETPMVNNSQSYITATAQVLAKAESHQFVIEMIAEDEKAKLSEQLKINLTNSESINALIDAWSQKTGNSPEELRSQLRFSQKKPPLSRADLKQWLENWVKL